MKDCTKANEKENPPKEEEKPKENEKSNKWNEYENLMKKISDKLNYKLKSVITDIKSVIGGKLAEKIGIKENELPSIRIIDTSGNYMKKYKIEGELNEKTIL